MRGTRELGCFLLLMIALSAGAVVRSCSQPEHEIQRNADTALHYYKVTSAALGFGVAAVLTIGLIDLLTSRWRRIRVFISFQHEREDEAAKAESILSQHSIKPFLLSYGEREHDDVLEIVNRELDKCDALVVFPGRERSFVDGEILVVASRRKPVLIVRHESGFLPDTAYRGYPVFNPEKLASDQYLPLARFTLYVCRHWRDALYNIQRAMVSAWHGLAAIAVGAVVAIIVRNLVQSILGFFSPRLATHFHGWWSILLLGGAAVIISCCAVVLQLYKLSAMRVARQKVRTAGLTYDILCRGLSDLASDEEVLRCLEQPMLVPRHHHLPGPTSTP